MWWPSQFAKKTVVIATFFNAIGSTFVVGRLACGSLGAQNIEGTAANKMGSQGSGCSPPDKAACGGIRS